MHQAERLYRAAIIMKKTIARCAEEGNAPDTALLGSHCHDKMTLSGHRISAVRKRTHQTWRLWATLQPLGFRYGSKLDYYYYYIIVVQIP